MLPRTQIKPLMKKLAIKEEKNVVFFLKRLEGWIRANGHTDISLAKGINKILDDIHKKEIQKAKEFKKINLEGIKHPLLKKYAKEIIELHLQGWGVRRIQKWLWEAHKAKISHSSIHRFIKQQKSLLEA
jgi:IS30 family transposase